MKPKILVVDDSSLARRMMRTTLTELGYEVEEASDGTQALERYFLAKHDLVVLDMVMTGMYGLEVLARLRQMNPEVRVIVATADIQQSTAQQVREGGAVAFINKPVNRKQLADTVTVALAGGTTWT